MNKKHLKTGIGMLLLCIAIFGCSDFSTKENTDNQSKSQKEEKDSELALLMRKMKKDFFALHDSLKAGKNIHIDSLIQVYQNIKTATPTDSTVKGPVFESFGNNFLTQLKTLDTAGSSVSAFNATIDACIDCHKTYCPGPVKVIKKIYVKK